MLVTLTVYIKYQYLYLVNKIPLRIEEQKKSIEQMGEGIVLTGDVIFKMSQKQVNFSPEPCHGKQLSFYFFF